MDNINFKIDFTPIGLDKAAQVPSTLQNIDTEASKVKADFDRMCNMQPFVTLGRLLADISGKLSALNQTSFISMNNLRALNDKSGTGLRQNRELADKLATAYGKVGHDGKGAGDRISSGMKNAKRDTGNLLDNLSKFAPAPPRRPRNPPTPHRSPRTAPSGWGWCPSDAPPPPRASSAPSEDGSSPRSR